MEERKEHGGGRPVRFRGRVHVVRDAEGRAIDDINTDMIFHNAHLAITDPARMGPLAFGNLKGWEDFPRRARPGDLLVVGKNFGAGSSRQQAVDCFIALGIRAVIGESFGAIYFRNAVNAGLPVIRVPGIMDTPLKSGDTVEVDLESGSVRAVAPPLELPPPLPFSRVQLEIYKAGSLFRVRPGDVEGGGR